MVQHVLNPLQIVIPFTNFKTRGYYNAKVCSK